MKILLLEDNQRLNDLIVKTFTLKGHKVDSFMDGQEAIEAIFNGYDCYILDINVPSLDGIDILKEIRKTYKSVPAIIISSTIEIETIKKSYAVGCDDYLKKPFYIDELELKIERLCKVDDSIVHISNDCTFDVENNILIYQNQEQTLAKKEKLLLNLLAKNMGKTVTFEQIQSYAWEGNVASTDSIRSLVMRLRKKLPPEVIKTLIDEGYCLKKV